MSIKILSRIVAAIALACLLMVAAPALDGASSAPVWEELQRATHTDDAAVDVVDVELRDGKIYIVVHQPVKVEIFTILGQLVTSRRLTPGLTRLTLPQRGLYILKAGPVARRINI